jgi:hypothetical protein
MAREDHLHVVRAGERYMGYRLTILTLIPCLLIL